MLKDKNAKSFRRTKEQSVGVVVSDQALYEVSDDSSGAPPEVRRWHFREIHSVHKLEKNLVRVFLISVSAHGKVSKEKVISVCVCVCVCACVRVRVRVRARALTRCRLQVKGWGAGETASNFLIPRDFICATTNEKDELFSVMRTHLVDTWQAHLECMSPLPHCFYTLSHRRTLCDAPPPWPPFFA